MGDNLSLSVIIKNLSSSMESWSWFTQIWLRAVARVIYSPQLRRITDISCFRCHPIQEKRL